MRLTFLISIFCLAAFFAQANTFLPANHYKQENVRKVYFDIATAVLGDHLGSLPSIKMVTEKRKVAAYNEEDRLITIDEAAYDICTSFGKDSLNALAVIIGHEFAHYYREHIRSPYYRCIHFDKDENLRDKIELERDADFYGLFSTYLAKYNTLNISSILLEKIYAQYKLKEELPGYPSLNIRQTINSSVEEKVQELIRLYETANYLVVIGEYIPASHCYQNILNEYESVEILNNYATSIILEEIKKINNNNSSLIYPLELDLNSRLYKHISYGTPGPVSIKLFEVINILEKALQYNPEHSATHLNLACAYSLQGLTANASGQLQKAQQYDSSDAWKERCMILEAIILAQSDKASATKVFKSLAEQSSNTYTKEVANFNAKHLEGYRPKIQEYNSIQISDQIENTPIKVTRFNKKINISNQDRSLYNLKWKTKGKSSFSCLENDVNNNVIYLHKTTDASNRTNKGIKVGSSAKDVLKSYSKEKRTTIAHKDGYFLVFPSNGLVFRIGKEDKVEEWAIYSL